MNPWGPVNPQAPKLKGYVRTRPSLRRQADTVYLIQLSMLGLVHLQRSIRVRSISSIVCTQQW